jgi:glycosyltransferase involved in cell wall biosynthesis
MRDIVLDSGIDERKVFQIPISIEIENFLFSTSKESRTKAKEALNIDSDSFLIGSFQKDGIGWGSGNQPKMIKGPDIFLKVVGALKDKYPELSVLLTGPARGYVKLGLEAMNIKYYHYNLKDYSDISSFYQALDLYLVTSREEGGPRSILESMASGVPLVTTKVGQATDLVENNKNGWIVENEDIEALIHCSKLAIDMGEDLERILVNARETAKQNSYSAQESLWRNFMEGFVDL